MDNNLIWVITLAGIAIIILIIIFYSIIRGLNSKIREQDAILKKDEAEKDLEIVNGAHELLEKFKATELELKAKELKEIAEREAAVLFEVWKIRETDRIRKESVNKSMGANYGKITEHLLPFSEYLQQFNPRDIRFIGSPVDLMIFEGITERKEIVNIHFVEIKTGGGQLSKKQRIVGDAIAAHRIKWLPIFVPKFSWKVADTEDEE
jgi:predicted Holliday junction resolvase-like endonuclease